MQTAIKTFLAALLCLLTLTGCQPQSPVCAARFTHPVSREMFCDFSVSAGDDAAQLRLVINLKHGSVKWVLVDPQGLVRWEGRAAPELPTDLSRTFENPSPGRWNLTLLVDNATGSCQAPWITE